MPNPFPGIDPYIEDQGRWPDFHGSFLTYCRDALNERLPEAYIAQMDEQVHLVRTPRGSAPLIRPDIAVLREPRSESRFSGSKSTGGMATLEPVTIPLETDFVEEVRETWIEIRQLPKLSLVTVIELLSPSNKVGNGREEYLHKRLNLIDQTVHIVELDFLIAGQRLPMRRPLPAGDAYALVARAERRPDADVYAWTVRDSLPKISIPLEAPDPDIPLDLASAYEQAYERGLYSRILRHGEPLSIPLAPDERAWAEEQGVSGR
jgi:hypothetical protein